LPNLKEFVRTEKKRVLEKIDTIYFRAKRRLCCISSPKDQCFVYAFEFTSLSRGYVDKGVQVWDLEKGAYRFEPYILAKE